jgi:hypothetical protein
MRQTKLEITDPAQWLRSLSQERDGYSRLVRESKGTASAAYRIARARCHGDAPLLDDLQSATSLLAARLGGESSLPIRSLLPSAISGVMPAVRPISTAPESAQTTRPQVQPAAPSDRVRPSRPRSNRATA